MIDASIQLLPVEAARDTVEGLAAEHGGQRPWTYWLVLAGITGLLGCLPFIEIDVSVSAPGVIRPATERAEVRPSVPGHIERVLAHDNDRVAAGQPLLVLTSRDLDERLARNLTLQSGHADLIADLELLTAESMGRMEGDGHGPLVASIKAAVGFRTPALRREHAQLLAQLAANQLAETKARTECERYATLAAKGIVSRSELDRARYEVERLQAEAVLVVRQSLAGWQERLRAEDTSLADLRSEAKRLRGELAHFTIRAPVEGLLIGFTGWSAGGFVSSGQVLGAVSPSDTLLVEAVVSPRDIGLIGIGQAARIQVDAFPYTQWGTLDGTVLTVSGDSIGAPISDAASAPWFKVVVRPAAGELRMPGGTRGMLKKGLTVQTRFLVSRRSLLQLLYGDAGTWLNPQESRRPRVRPGSLGSFPGMTPGT